MLPTFVIGLREGLEAALIVSIIATFLRRAGASLRPMWIGLSLAVALSVAVGVVLSLIEHALPQRQQEGMETVIGAIAVVFVTGMVLWMRKHARFLKRDLEQAANDAVGAGTALALGLMVFLAVLREGFETSVFLLATFQNAASGTDAAIGAVLGIAVSIGLGYAIYAGGVRLNLARFFSITSAFLILVAAGLVLGALRTGHEAGWVTVGQGQVLDLSWLAPLGSVRAALLTGVLGIPGDPRAVEVLGWLCYLVPVALLVYLPARFRPEPAREPRLKVALAAAMAVAAVVLVVSVPTPQASASASAPLADGGTARLVTQGDRATLRVRTDSGTESVPLRSPRQSESAHFLTVWTGAPAAAAELPASLSLQDLLTYTGGRIPVGLDARQAPGPYEATWRDRAVVSVETFDDGLVAGARRGSALVTLSGGGLSTPRTLSVTAPGGTGEWQVAPTYSERVQQQISVDRRAAHDRTLWTGWFPAVLLLGAVLLLLSAWRQYRSRPTRDNDVTTTTTDQVTSRDRASTGSAV